MNIFVTSKCPIKSAEYLDNKRVVKMILESAQMLSTAQRLNGNDDPVLYKATHVNHPCSVWVRESESNYSWLFRHYIALINQYKKRYGKKHKSMELISALKPDIVLTETPDRFINCARNKNIPGCDYTNLEDVFLAYQLYLNDRWDNDKREPSWEIRYD